MNHENDVRLDYRKGEPVTIQRLKHYIGFEIGSTPDRLMELLRKVPPRATVDEVTVDEDLDVVEISFHEESRIES